MECTICIEEIDRKDRVELMCGHCFHAVCIMDWFIDGTSSCPICRLHVPKHAFVKGEISAKPPVKLTTYGLFDTHDTTYIVMRCESATPLSGNTVAHRCGGERIQG
jgi:Ring finger domain